MSSLNPSSINGLNLYTYANNNPIAIAYNTSSIGGSVNGGMINTTRSNVFNSSTYTNKGGFSLPQIPWLVDNATLIHGLGSSLSAGLPIAGFYFKYANVIRDEFMLYGISKWKTSLDLSNVNLKMTGLDWAFIGINVFLDMYDSIQNGASFGSVVAGAGLTLAKDVGMLYLNKGIIWAATSIGTAICPGLGTGIGFVVGFAGSILVDIFLGEWLDELIDKITQ